MTHQKGIRSLPYGTWCADMARLFPDALVLGLDILTELFHQSPPANCLLRTGNILTGLPLPDALFEFTHQRFLEMSIPDAQWPNVVQELVRVTRPGGWIELVEPDVHTTHGGSATKRIFDWVDVALKARGITGTPILHLRELLTSARLTEIEAQEIPLKIGPWGGRSGLMTASDILAGVQALKAPCCALGVDPQEYEACVQAMVLEWKQAHAFCTIHIAYGRRGSS